MDLQRNVEIIEKTNRPQFPDMRKSASETNQPREEYLKTPGQAQPPQINDENLKNIYETNIYTRAKRRMYFLSGPNESVETLQTNNVSGKRPATSFPSPKPP